MRSKFVTVYSVIALAVLAAAVLWFCISIFSETARGSAQADRTFSWLCREASQHSYSLGFMTDAYIDQITEICQGINTLIAMTISSPTETFYAWAETSSALAETESGATIQRSSLFSKVISSNVDMGANASPAITITASLRTISSLSIFAASRNAFILVFLVLLSSIIVLLVTPSRERGQEKESIQERDSPANNININIEEKPNSAFSWEDSPLFSSYTKTESTKSEPEYAKESVAETKSSNTDHLFRESSVVQQDFNSDVLVSDILSFGGKYDFESKLNTNLINAASSEQDISILILRVLNLTRADAVFRIVADILVDMFKKENVFEYASDAYSCIIPNSSLDETMQVAENLYSALQAYFTEEDDYKLCIGISTRAGRTVPAFKMVEEAETATKKAEEEKRLPIVAFRANPQKIH